MKKLLLFFSLLIAFSSQGFAEGFPAVKVYKGTSKAVVLIVAQKDKKSSMIGAGSIISPTGYVVTNAHVVIDKGTKRPFSTIRVFIKPPRVTGDFQRDLVNKYKASVASYDNELDLAVLKVDGLSLDAELIELANSDEIDIGEEVVAIGHPEQGGLWSLTYGRISGQIANQSNIRGKDVFQTDTSVNRGNSGGPLLDRRGYMVGINTNIARLGAGNMPITGVNFAVKSSVVRKWLAGKGLVLAFGSTPLYEEVKPVKVEAEKAPAIEEKHMKDVKKQPSVDEPTKEDVEQPKTKEKKSAKIETPVEKEPLKEKAKPEKEIKPVEKKSIKPSEKKKAAEKQKRDIIEEEKTAKTDKPEKIPEDRILTPKRPYNIDDLFKEVEKEMEDIMEEMRWKIRKR